MEQYKTCTKCGQSKSTNFFYKKKSGKFGVSALCSLCDNAISKKWRDENPEKKKLADARYAANNKEKVKLIKDRWSAKNAESEKIRKNKAYLLNKDAHKKSSLEWAKNNRETINAYKRKWRKSNPEKVAMESANYRAKKLQNGIFVVLKKEITRLKNSPCLYCGSWSKITIDHIVPISRGGRHCIGNLAPACGGCNSTKGNKFIMEWKIKKS